jgi:hypothetical protein
LFVVAAVLGLDVVGALRHMRRSRSKPPSRVIGGVSD